MSAAHLLSAALRLAAKPFCLVTWQLEAWAARLEDRFANSPPGQQKARPPATKDERADIATHTGEAQPLAALKAFIRLESGERRELLRIVRVECPQLWAEVSKEGSIHD